SSETQRRRPLKRRHAAPSSLRAYRAGAPEDRKCAEQAFLAWQNLPRPHAEGRAGAKPQGRGGKDPRPHAPACVREFLRKKAPKEGPALSRFSPNPHQNVL